MYCCQSLLKSLVLFQLFDSICLSSKVIRFVNFRFKIKFIYGYVARFDIMILTLILNRYFFLPSI